MEICYSSQPMKIDPSLEDNYDDDLFYAELRRQIFLLTAEDDDDNINGAFAESKFSNSTRGGKRDSCPSCSPSLAPLPGGRYFSWMESENTNTVPAWLVNLWRYGNGTGVFIPLTAAKPRRRSHRSSGRRYNDSRKAYKPMTKKNE